MQLTIKQKRGTASAINTANPTLAAGELAFETDTGRFKVGDGATAWSGLAYVRPYVSDTDRILGRSSAGAGPAEEITCTAAGRALLGSATSAAQLATLGAAPTASPTFTGTVTIPDGSAASPSVTWSGDTDTGLYRHADNTVGITCSGTSRLQVSGSALYIASASVLVGTATSRTAGPAAHPVFQFEGTTAGSVSYQCICGSATAAVSPQIILARHRGAVGDSTAVIDGDSLGLLRFNGGDGTDCVSTGAQIECRVDGSPGGDDMPGRLIFSTTADGSASATERMRITSSGVIGISTAGSAAAPAVYLNGDVDTGLFGPASNVLAVATAGGERLRVDASGNVLVGATTSRTAGPATHPRFQFEGTNAGSVSYQCICGSTTATVSPQILLARHRGGVGDSTAVIDGDSLGLIRFNGGDGTDCASTAAQIECRVDGSPGSNDMPGRLIFSTTADAASTATERLRIDSRGNVLIAGTASPTAGVGTLCVFNATAPTASVANGVVLYSEDVSSSAELKVRDEAGNVTTLSPHNFALIPGGPSEPMAWAYYSEREGHRINVDMLRLARLVERLTGETLVYEESP